MFTTNEWGETSALSITKFITPLINFDLFNFIYLACSHGIYASFFKLNDAATTSYNIYVGKILVGFRKLVFSISLHISTCSIKILKINHKIHVSIAVKKITNKSKPRTCSTFLDFFIQATAAGGEVDKRLHCHCNCLFCLNFRLKKLRKSQGLTSSLLAFADQCYDYEYEIYAI